MLSLPCPAEEGSYRVALVSTWNSSKVNPPQQDKENMMGPKGIWLEKRKYESGVESNIKYQIQSDDKRN